MTTKALTARAVDTLRIPAGKPNVTLWDAACPGLGVRKGKRGTSWILRVQIDGKRRIETFGSYPSMGLADARAYVASVRDGSEQSVLEARLQSMRAADDRRPAGDASSPQKALSEAVTVQEGFELHFARHVAPNLARPEAIRGHWARDLAPLVGHLRMSDLRRADVLAVVDTLSATKTKAVSAAGIRLLRSTLNWLADREYVEAGIAARIRVKPPAARSRVFSPDELRQVISAAEAMGIRPAGVVRLLCLTACRKDEIAGLRWGEIDLAQRLITLSAERVKTGEARIVYLSGAAVELINGLRPHGDETHVFPALRAGTKLGYYDAGNLPSQIRRKLAWADFRLHDLRRSAASALASAGYDQTVIKLVLGHVSGQVFTGATGAYVTRAAYEQRCREAVETLAQIVAE